MIIRGAFSDFFLTTMLPAMNGNIWDAYRLKPKVFTKLFQVETSTRGIEQFSNITGMGTFAAIPDGEAIRFDQPVQAFEKTFTHTRYGLGVKVSQDVVEDDKVGLVRRQSLELGRSSHESQELDAATTFNSAFATVTGPDGQFLCDSDHPLPKAGGTQSNLLSVAADLSVTSLELALTDWETMKNFAGQHLSLPTPRLLAAPANRWNAHEIMKGTWRSDTANRTVNAFQYGENGPIDEIIIWAKLTDPDAWFLVAPPDATGLMWFWRREPYTKGSFDDQTETGMTMMRYKKSHGFTNFYGVYGTPGA